MNSMLVGNDLEDGIIMSFSTNEYVSRISLTTTIIYEVFEDSKGTNIIRKSKKNMQDNGQKKKDKQRSTKYTLKTKDRVTRTPLKSEDQLGCSRRVSSSCSTSDTSRVNLVTNPVISHEYGKNRDVLTTSGTYLWSSVTQISHNGQPSHGGGRKTFKVMTLT
jgi:hypothetical protein